MSEKNQPVQVRIRRIKAAVFGNGEDAPRKVAFTALYKNGDTWKGSQSLSREDVPPLAKVADQVHTYLYEQNGSSAS
jgi:hypothetical protein